MRPITRRLRRSEVWARWLPIAASLALEPGDPADLVLGCPGDPDYTLYSPRDCDDALGRLIAYARSRRPLVTLAELDGKPALAVDPQVPFDRRAIEAALVDLHSAHKAARDRLILTDLGSAPDARAAARAVTGWGISRRTAYRVRERVPNLPLDGTETADLGSDSIGTT